VPSTTTPNALTGEVIVFSGKLSSIERREAQQAVVRLGGSVAGEVSDQTTILVLGSGANGSEVAEARHAAAQERAEALNAASVRRIRIITESDFCRLAGVLTPDRLRQQFYAVKDIRGMYPVIRDDHLRYLDKLGLVQPVARVRGDRYYSFADLAAIKQVAQGLEQGQRLRQVLRALEAARKGQLAFDFDLLGRADANPARVVELDRSRSVAVPSRTPEMPPPAADPRARLAARYFLEGASLDGEDQRRDEAAAAYRKALVVDPDLVPALVNLANTHYAGDRLIEAQALYERAIRLEPDCFEAYFNLGNIHHDLGRYEDALACYEEAVALNPSYADAHFYLAVTLEKTGRSHEARPHWRSYQQLAPDGEWVELAKEFSE